MDRYQGMRFVDDHKVFFAITGTILIFLVVLTVWVTVNHGGCTAVECVETYKTFLTIMGAIITGITGLVAWLVTQWRENGRRRFETFFKMREEFRQNPRFGKLFPIIDGDAKLWLESTKMDDDAAELASFLEEIAVLVQSGIISSELAHYFFGYYAIKMTENPEFMKKIENKETIIYWALLRRFAGLMREEQDKLKNDPSKIVAGLRV